MKKNIMIFVLLLGSTSVKSEVIDTFKSWFGFYGWSAPALPGIFNDKNSTLTDLISSLQKKPKSAVQSMDQLDALYKSTVLTIQELQNNFEYFKKDANKAKANLWSQADNLKLLISLNTIYLLYTIQTMTMNPIDPSRIKLNDPMISQMFNKLMDVDRDQSGESFNVLYAIFESQVSQIQFAPKEKHYLMGDLEAFESFINKNDADDKN